MFDRTIMEPGSFPDINSPLLFWDDSWWVFCCPGICRIWESPCGHFRQIIWCKGIETFKVFHKCRVWKNKECTEFIKTTHPYTQNLASSILESASATTPTSTYPIQHHFIPQHTVDTTKRSLYHTEPKQINWNHSIQWRTIQSIRKPSYQIQYKLTAYSYVFKITTQFQIVHNDNTKIPK